MSLPGHGCRTSRQQGTCQGFLIRTPFPIGATNFAGVSLIREVHGSWQPAGGSGGLFVWNFCMGSMERDAGLSMGRDAGLVCNDTRTLMQRRRTCLQPHPKSRETTSDLSATIPEVSYSDAGPVCNDTRSLVQPRRSLLQRHPRSSAMTSKSWATGTRSRSFVTSGQPRRERMR